MKKYFVLNGTDNVIDMRRYKAWKDAVKLFSHYKTRLYTLKSYQIEEERVALVQEKSKFPEHLLTKVKLQIFENVTGTKI